MFLDLLLQLLPQLLPILLSLLKKDATQRKEAAVMAKAMQTAAVRTGNAEMILIGGLVQRVSAMSDAEQAEFISHVEAAQAKIEEINAAMAAKKGSE